MDLSFWMCLLFRTFGMYYVCVVYHGTALVSKHTQPPFHTLTQKILTPSPPQDMAASKQQQGQTESSDTLPSVSFRLVIQTSQCGSLIGKGGSKIKEIREVSVLVHVVMVHVMSSTRSHVLS